MSKYRFIEDPGHGWLEVPLVELVDLGILNKISGFSYRSRDWRLVYLEEDCDFATFARAKKWDLSGSFCAEEDCPWTTVYEDPTFVRDLPSLRGQDLKGV